MSTEPILALFKSTNIGLFAVNRRMSAAEFRKVGKARHVSEVTSRMGALVDWLCGTHKEMAKQLAHHVQNASDPQRRLASAVMLQKLVAAPYQGNFRFESVDETTVKFRVSGRGIQQEVTVTPAPALTAVRDAILSVKRAGVMPAGVAAHGGRPAHGAQARQQAGAERGVASAGGPRVDPIDLNACPRYQELTRGRANAWLVALLGALADPAAFWAIKAALDTQRELAMPADLPRRQWMVAAGYLRERAATGALHFRPTLALTEPVPGVFQLAWHAEPEALEHKCAHRTFDVVLLVTRAHMHCLYAG